MKKLAQLVAFLSLALSLSAQADNPRLHMAVAGHQRAEVEALIKETPELVNAQDDHGITPIFVAMLVDDMEMAKYLLKNGADLKIGMTAARLTPLHMAVADGKKAWADLFLASGATATMANHEKHTVLHSAASGWRSSLGSRSPSTSLASS